MTTAIYIRTSTKEQTPELQLRDIKTITNTDQYKIYIDKQSAWNDLKEREQFNKLKKDIKYKRIKHLIVWDLDRIYRNRKNLIDFFRYCNHYKCIIESYRQQWLNELKTIPPPFDEIVYNLMLQIMGWISEEESTKKSQRVKLAITKKDNKTYSKYGKKWGRKTLSTQKQNQLKTYIIDNPKDSIRTIAKNLNLKPSTVHKYLMIIKQEK